MFRRDDHRSGAPAGRPAALFGQFNASRDHLVFALIACVACLFPGCRPSPKQAGPPEAIRIAAFKGELSALVWLADSEGFFTKHGLQARVTGFVSGVASVDDLLAGNEDVATAADSVFVSKSLAPGTEFNLMILGEIASSDSIEIVARLDRGVSSPADLKGKTIALTRQTPSDYFLDRYLLNNHLDPRSITIVDLPPLQVVEAVVQGSVDAAVTWEPHVWNIEQQLSGNGRTWSAQSDQQFHFLLLSTPEFAEKRPEAARRLFRALADAEALVRNDPERARQSLSRRLALDERYLAAVWPKQIIELSLEQSLLVSLEDHARWQISSGVAPTRRPPNYLKSLCLEPLVAVRPGAVTLYR